MNVSGVVGFATVESQERLVKELDEFTRNKKFVGVRRIPGLEQDGWFERDDVINGLKILKKYDIPFELLVSQTNA